MKTTTIQFAVSTKDGVVQKIGRCQIELPKVNYKGSSMKWYKDKMKKEK